MSSPGLAPPRPPRAVPLLAAVLAAALGGCTAAPVVSPPATTPAAATPAASPTAGGPVATATQTPATPPAGSPPPAGAGWHYLADFPAGRAIEVSAVVSRGEGFLAVGFEPAAGEGFGGRRNGVVWTSADGRTWERARPAGWDDFAPLHLASLAETLYAFGRYSICLEFSEEEDCQDAPDAGIAAWRSTDGAAWHRLPVPESMRLAILDGVAVGLDQLVAYGSSGEELLAVAWLSGDGETWTEITDVAAVDPISALGAGPDRLVAFGTRYLPLEDDVETLAGYSDGGAFQVGHLPADQRGTVQSAAWGSAGFVAVGQPFFATPDAVNAIALVSADGITWSAASPPDLPAGAAFQHVLALAGAYLAIGSEPLAEEFDRERASAWYSLDGLAWRDHGDLGGGAFRQLSSSAVGSGGAVVFATDFAEADEEELFDDAEGTIHAWFAGPESLP